MRHFAGTLSVFVFEKNTQRGCWGAPSEFTSGPIAEEQKMNACIMRTRTHQYKAGIVLFQPVCDAHFIPAVKLIQTAQIAEITFVHPAHTH
jgi:hypothetical protein